MVFLINVIFNYKINITLMAFGNARLGGHQGMEYAEITEGVFPDIV